MRFGGLGDICDSCCVLDCSSQRTFVDIDGTDSFDSEGTPPSVIKGIRGGK